MLTVSKEEMRARYWELMDAREEVLKEAAPSRTKYNALKEKIAPLEMELRKHRAEFIKVEQPRLSAIANECAMIQKALSGKVGERVAPDDS